jgi:hypothetical protein
MSICSLIIGNLGAIGLGFDLIGASLMVGNRFIITRRLGLWLSPVHARRMNSYQNLLENDKIGEGTEGFDELREEIAPPSVFERQKTRASYGLDYTHIELDGSQVVVHADETGTPSNLSSGINIRRDLKSVDETLERTFEKMFLNYGVALLAIGFALQILATLFAV